MSQTSNSSSGVFLYYFFTILSHVLFGLQPVFSRYLQRPPARLPPLSLLCMGFASVLLLYVPKITYKSIVWFKEWSARDGLSAKSIGRAVAVFFTDFVLNWKMHLCVFSIVARYGTTFYSAGYTNAVYVQLIALLSPFMISVILSRFLGDSLEGRMNKLTPKTFSALAFTVIGSILIILGGVRTTPKHNEAWYDILFNFEMDWGTLGSDLTRRDDIGMSLALVSTFFISVYMIMLRLCKTNTSCKASAWLTDGENFFLYQNAATLFTFLGPSLMIEDWSHWTNLTISDWILFLLFSVLVMLVATLASIMAIQKLGPSTVGSTTSVRMISAIVFSGFMLGERLQSAWQVIGSAIVLISVSLFLYWQKIQQQQIMNAKKE
jgi:drug/metabolite transporter (DMT)-like permease